MNEHSEIGEQLKIQLKCEETICASFAAHQLIMGKLISGDEKS